MVLLDVVVLSSFLDLVRPVSQLTQNDHMTNDHRKPSKAFTFCIEYEQK